MDPYGPNLGFGGPPPPGYGMAGPPPMPPQPPPPHPLAGAMSPTALTLLQGAGTLPPQQPPPGYQPDPKQMQRLQDALAAFGRP